MTQSERSVPSADYIKVGVMQLNFWKNYILLLQGYGLDSFTYITTLIRHLTTSSS